LFVKFICANISEGLNNENMKNYSCLVLRVITDESEKKKI